MERRPVVSETVASVGYDGDALMLEVEFRRTGHIYEYFDVPAPVFEEFMAAPSLGLYLNTQIKPNFRYSRI